MANLIQEHTHCTNLWCGQKLSFYDRRTYKDQCRFCEYEIATKFEEERIAYSLGSDDDRRPQPTMIYTAHYLRLKNDHTAQPR